MCLGHWFLMLVSKKMKIVFIGSGNVASHLATALKTSGNEIVQVYSRTKDNAVKLAGRVGAKPIDDMGDLCRDAELYLFSVKDDALPQIIVQMPPTTGVWAHTAGSIPISVFAPHECFGVIYPLQTFSKERDVDFWKIPIFIEGNNAETALFLQGLAETISGNVQLLPGGKRRKLHLAAVFACNFSNHMYTLAAEIMGEEGMPFHLLNPLIAETAAKAAVMDPHAAQTGPAMRFDEVVMQEHLALLDDPMKKEIYALLSKSIHQVSKM